MKTWIKRALWLLLTALLAALVVFAYRPKPLAVEAATIGRGRVRVEAEADGRTRVKDRFIVSAPLSGAVSRPALRAGDRVKQGDPLVTLDPSAPPLLDARSRAQSEAQVRLSRAARAQAEARVDVARTALDFARVELERTRNLSSSGSLPQVSLDAAELKWKTSEQEYASAKLGVEMARFDQQTAEAALSSPTSPRGGVTLRSPTDGAVLRVLLEDGGVVPAGTAILEIGDPRALEVVVDLLSMDAVNVRPGAAVVVERWGGDDALSAQVRTVEPAGFTKVSALGIEEQRVHVIADFTSPPSSRAALGDGYRIQARVVLFNLPDVVRVPLSALFRDGDAWAVYALTGASVTATRVSIGRRNQRYAEVLSGLAEGTRVIVHPSDKLREGIQVMPKANEPRREESELASTGP